MDLVESDIGAVVLVQRFTVGCLTAGRVTQLGHDRKADVLELAQTLLILLVVAM